MADQKPTNRERVKEIVAGIEQNIQELFQSEKYFDYLRTMSRFHNYSVNNTMLIHMQRPDAATPVAGFNKWKQFGRHVKKGEKGLTIIAPTPLKKKIEEMKLDPDTNAPVLDQDGNAIIEERTIEIPLFKPVKVFSADQTDGKPLPSLVTDLTGDVQQYEAFMEALRRTSPVPVEIKPIEDSMDGFFSRTTQSITVREGMSEVQTVCATVHEIAHAVLHNKEQDRLTSAAGDTDKEPPQAKDKNTMEVEAESVSFAVCQYYGIDTASNSIGYIAGWSKDRSLPELKASLETITKTVGGLISAIDKHFAEICKERGIDLTTQQLEQDTPAVAPDTPEKFAADLYDFMDQLHQAGILEHPWTQDPREQPIADLVAEIQNGNFDGVRDPLAYVIAHTDLITARTLTGRMDMLAAELENWESVSTHYVTDFFSHLNELYEAGLVPAPYRTDQQDKFEKAFLTYMHDGNFDSFRYVLKDVEERANTPNVPTLRERLEKLSDRWDAALICKIEPVFGADSTIDRSAIQTYQKQGDQLIPCKPVFVGSMAECQRVVAGLEAGTITMRQMRQPDFEPPKPQYVYKMEANHRTGGRDDRHFIQAYEQTAKGTLIPEKVLFVERTNVCAKLPELLEQLQNGTLQHDDFFTVSAARISCYTTTDGAELDAFVTPDDKVYLGRRDHYDNCGHYLNNDDSLIHISDNERVFNVISGSDIPYTHDQLMEMGYFTQEEFERFTALRLNEPHTEKETEALFPMDDAVYLHVQTCDEGWDYTLYEKESKMEMDGGLLDAPDLSITAAAARICHMQEIGTESIHPVSMELLEALQDAQSLPPAPEKPRDYAGELREHFAQEDAALPDTTLDEYPLPDPVFQADELETEYGYMEGDLLPLGRDRAFEMLGQDFTVYAIVDGGSAEMVFDREDLDERPLDAMFAVSKEEWEASPDFQQAVADRMQHQEDRERAFLGHGGDCFAIYQIKDDPALRDIRFESMDWLKSKGQTVERGNYELVYTAPLTAAASVDAALGQLWYQFNNEHPADYQHPSMSVSDIIAIKRDGVLSCHYCDSFGFQQLPDFIKPENYLKNAEVSTEDDLSMIDGIINNGSKATVAELEQQARNGQPISLMDLADAVRRERGEKKSVLAKLNAKQPKQERKKSAPKKSAERGR